MAGSMETGNRIPKLLHYCWYGNKELPEQLQKCVDTWAKLDGYKTVRWDESNCAFNETEYVKTAYEKGAWAFVCDYYRLKALYEQGGIYLDTDVKVYKDFGELLQLPMFLSFIYNCSIGTAVIGSEPHNPIIADILEMYAKTRFTDEKLDRQIVERDGYYFVNHFVTNNYYFTYYLLKNYPEFMLNNKKQVLDHVTIFPKEYFETGSLLKKHYTIHYCSGTWKKKKKSANEMRKAKLKKTAEKTAPKLFEYLMIIVRKTRYRVQNKTIPFYSISVEQKKNKWKPVSRV